MKLIGIIFSVLLFFGACAQDHAKQHKGGNLQNRRVMSVSLSYAGGMQKPPDTQRYYAVSKIHLYKVAAVYSTPKNSIIYDSVIMPEQNFKTAKALIDSIPAYIFSSSKTNIGVPADYNDGSYLNLKLYFNDNSNLNLYKDSVPHEVKQYIRLAEDIYNRLPHLQ